MCYETRVVGCYEDALKQEPWGLVHMLNDWTEELKTEAQIVYDKRH